MPDVKAAVSNAVNWPFLQEPLWRWFVFIVAMGAILGVWAGVLRMIRGTAASA